jgi:hypothetical protein
MAKAVGDMGYFLVATSINCTINIKPMTILLLPVICPILQVTLSALRISGRIVLPLSIIAACAFILGIILTIIVMNSSEFAISPKPHQKCIDCGMVSVFILVIGFIFTLISAITICLISYLIYYLKNRPKTTHST